MSTFEVFYKCLFFLNNLTIQSKMPMLQMQEMKILSANPTLNMVPGFWGSRKRMF